MYARLLGLVFFVTTNVVADNSSIGLQLPSMGSSYSSDKIRAGDLECSHAIGGATNVEFGVTGVIQNAVTPFIGDENPNDPQSKDIGMYARIIIPLDAPKERLNCNKLYQLELQRRRIEVLKLQQELEALKALQKKGFEN